MHRSDGRVDFRHRHPVKNNNDVTYNFTVTNIGDRPPTSADPAPNAVVVTINLDTIFNKSTPVSVSAPGFMCVTTSPPVPVSAPEIVDFVDEHDDPTDINFGCSPTWFIEGSTGTKGPDYLDPASDGVLINKSQTTTGMGVWVNADRHKCIDDATWEADTIDPDTTPFKWKQRYGKASNSNICH